MDTGDSSLNLLDILRGYSILKKDGRIIYLKHFSVMEYAALEEIEREHLELAVKYGIKTEEGLIERAISLGSWKKEEEKELKDGVWEIDKLEKAARKITDKREKKAFLDSADPQRERVETLRKKRRSITSHSAEGYAAEKRIKALLEDMFFKDREFTEKLSDKETAKFATEGFLIVSKFFERDVLLHAAYNPSFFDLFSIHSSDPSGLIGKSIYEISVFQSRLLSFANALLSRLKNMADIPESVASDPVKLYTYEEAENKGGNVTEGIDDLKQKMKRKGSITTEDLLN